MYHKNFGKEYFKDVQRKIREKRKASDPLYQKKRVYVAEIQGKKYAFLQKKQIKVEMISVDDFKADPNIIKCF